VVEHALWRDPDTGLLEEWQTRSECVLLTGTRTSYYEFEGSQSHPILRHAVHELHLVFLGEGSVHEGPQQPHAQ